jgi:hypothetical protein
MYLMYNDTIISNPIAWPATGSPTCEAMTDGMAPFNLENLGPLICTKTVNTGQIIFNI